MPKKLKKLFPLLILIVYPLLINASATISNFHARIENGNVVLFWDTLSENNVSRFDIYRSIDYSEYFKIGSVKSHTSYSNSNQSYQYIDNTISKSTTSAYQYQLEIVDQNNQSARYSVIVSVDGPSGIRRTWGSLKAMFR